MQTTGTLLPSSFRETGPNLTTWLGFQRDDISLSNLWWNSQLMNNLCPTFAGLSGLQSSPRKCKAFLWSFLLGAINTAYKLQKKNPTRALYPIWCSFSKRSWEDTKHLFISCPFASQFLSSYYKNFNIPWIQHGDFKAAMSTYFVAPFYWCYLARKKQACLFVAQSTPLIKGICQLVNQFTAPWAFISELFCNCPFTQIQANCQCSYISFLCLYYLPLISNKKNFVFLCNSPSVQLV